MKPSVNRILFSVLFLATAVVTGGCSNEESSTGQQETAVEHSLKHMDPQYQCPMHPQIVKDKPGNCPICGMNLELIRSASAEPAPVEKEKKILYWVAPMDPNYRRDGPGKSPMGMDLVPVYEETGDAAAAGPGVTISAQVENSLGVRTAIAEKGSLWRKIDTVGYVSPDESKLSHIHLRVDGWIEKLAVNTEGERVKKGQRLFDIYSPKLVNAMEEYVQALRSSSRRLIVASREKLQSLGVSPQQVRELDRTRKIPQTTSVYAPQDGIVSMLKVREGMYVMPAMQVMTLADLSSVWVLAEVFESQSEWVKTGQSADVELSFIPGRTWEGVVEYVYPSLDPVNRTLRVRLRFDNPDETLKPNMYANVAIYGGARQDVLSVPREALLRSGKNERLIIAQGNGRYEQREVVSGMESGDWIEIISGLREGERVVTSSQFLIDSEASMKASLMRMSSVDQPPEQMKPEEMKMETPTETMTAKGTGTVVDVMVNHGMLTLEHDPIDSLGWPAMTMDFTVQDGVSLEGLGKGDAVEFELVKKEGQYLVRSIKKQGEE